MTIQRKIFLKTMKCKCNRNSCQVIVLVNAFKNHEEVGISLTHTVNHFLCIIPIVLFKGCLKIRLKMN